MQLLYLSRNPYRFPKRQYYFCVYDLAAHFFHFAVYVFGNPFFYFFWSVQKNLRTKKDWLAKQKQVSINEAPQSQRNILTRAQILVLPLFVSFFLKKKKRKIFKKKNEKRRSPCISPRVKVLLCGYCARLFFFSRKTNQLAQQSKSDVLCSVGCVCVCVCVWVGGCVCAYVCVRGTCCAL